MLLRLLTQYGAFVQRRPMTAQMGTAGVIVTLGDIIAQTVIEKSEKFSFKRTAVMGFCGAFYFGPILATWLGFLNQQTYPLIAKVAMDQFLFTPPLVTGFFFTQSILMGWGTAQAQSKVKNELFGILKLNWSIWGPVQMINFYLIPFEYRMLVIQSVALFWNAYLSFKVNHRPNTEKMQ